MRAFSLPSLQQQSPMPHSPHMVQLSSLPTTGPMEQQSLHQQQPQLPPQPPPMGVAPTTLMTHPPPPLAGPGAIVPDAPQMIGAGNPMRPLPQPQQVVVTLSGTQTLPPSHMNGSLPGMLPPPPPAPPPLSLDPHPSLHLAPPPPPPAGQMQMNGSAMPHVAQVPQLNGGGPPLGQHHPAVITSMPAPPLLSTAAAAAAGPLPTTSMNGDFQHMNGGMQLHMHPLPPPQPQQVINARRSWNHFQQCILSFSSYI